MTRLVVERLNAGDAAGAAALYEPEAVLAYRADRPTTRRAAIQAVYQRMVDAGMRFGIETPPPTVRFEDLALTSTRSADNTGVRVQVLRRQLDGSWLRIINRPRGPTGIAAPASSTDTREITIYGWSTSEASPQTAEVSNHVIGKPQQ